MSRFIDLIGKRFNKVIVVEFVGMSPKNSVWKCLCTCGNVFNVIGYNLKNGHTTSCGCARTAALKKTAIKHGMCGTKFYNVFNHILQRCNNSKFKDFKNYGGRGIKCLWKSFADFNDDMYLSYQSHVKEFGETDTTIDRIDNSGNYCKENCRWATWKVQNNNKRKATPHYNSGRFNKGDIPWNKK